MKRSSTLHRYQNQGFTLVEMLIVIAIIGIIAGILIPTIGVVRKSAANGGMAMEVSNLSAAIEAYKQKYGDYPPDGSNIVVFQRHIQVAFPRIAPLELANLISFIDLKDGNGNSTGRTIIDPAEALVFFLGGFSDDPRYPFTGEGGPLSPIRKNPLFDFRAGKLTQGIFVKSAQEMNINVTLSTDEANLFLFNQVLTQENNLGRKLFADEMIALGADIFPAYIPSGSDIPFIYFDHRTYMSRPLYSFNGNLVPPAQYPPIERYDGPWLSRDGTLAVQANGTPYPGNLRSVYLDPLKKPWHSEILVAGGVRAYRSDEQNRRTENALNPDFKWIADNSFQIICAGVDNNLGILPTLINSSGWGPPSSKHFPSQKLFSDGDRSNIANFSAGVLEGGQ